MGNMNNIIIGGASVSIGNDLGFIRDGITITPAREHYFVEQLEGFPGKHKAKQTLEGYSITFSLEEPLLIAAGTTNSENIRKAWDITNAVAGVDPKTLDFGGDSVDPQNRIIIVNGVAPNAVTPALTTRSFVALKSIATAPGEMKITDFEETKLPMTIELMWDSAGGKYATITDT